MRFITLPWKNRSELHTLNKDMIIGATEVGTPTPEIQTQLLLTHPVVIKFDDNQPAPDFETTNFLTSTSYNDVKAILG